MFRIAIQPDHQQLTNGTYQSFSDRWSQKLREDGHEPHLVDASAPNFFDDVAGCDGFMWCYAHLVFPRNMARRIVPAVEHVLDVPVFPSWKTSWYFDDKISEYNVLRAAGVPTPRTWVFWDRAQATEFCRSARYPLVLKLASGITSENVRLVRDFGEAKHWIRRLFGSGLVTLRREPVTSARRAASRAKDIVWLLPWETPPRPGNRTDVQRGYMLLQEFLPGNAFDTRIYVIGNRAFAARRMNRPNDFRASGSGVADFDPAKIDERTVRLALQTARRLDAQSLAVDVLYRQGQPVLVEVSYYFEAWAVATCPGHWELHGDPDGGELEWVPGQTRGEDAVLDDFLARLHARAASL